eukprot:Clim_evm91s109 gene=Clim_evmTU91s109
MSFASAQTGAENTLDYRVFCKKDGQVVSFWHDVPLTANGDLGYVNFICEVPRYTNAKMEISKEEPLNPILQDTKKGKLRYVRNVFPHHGYMWNYGAIPQTWEDPAHKNEDTGCNGDNDPLDACDIGSTIPPRGAIYKVKVLGLVALIDDGETDWKIIVVNADDPLAGELNDIDDVKTKCPGLLEQTVSWFTNYKVPDGKPKNQFAFNGEAKNREYAINVIKETHEAWKGLVAGTLDPAGCNIASVIAESANKMSDADATMEVTKRGEPLSGEAVPKEIDQVFYVE